MAHWQRYVSVGKLVRIWDLELQFQFLPLGLLSTAGNRVESKCISNIWQIECSYRNHPTVDFEKIIIKSMCMAKTWGLNKIKAMILDGLIAEIFGVIGIDMLCIAGNSMWINFKCCFHHYKLLASPFQQYVSSS